MRSTIIPAQITTVEDKIAGNLGVTQLLLLVSPIFGGSAFFVLLPPFFGYALYKVVLIVCLAATCGMLAMRFKGVIVLRWLIILAHYGGRPRYFVFDKSDIYLREMPAAISKTQETAEEKQLIPPQAVSRASLDISDLMRAEEIMKNPDTQMQFKTNRKGELQVYVAEIQ